MSLCLKVRMPDRQSSCITEMFHILKAFGQAWKYCHPNKGNLYQTYINNQF